MKLEKHLKNGGYFPVILGQGQVDYWHKAGEITDKQRKSLYNGEVVCIRGFSTIISDNLPPELISTK